MYKTNTISLACEMALSLHTYTYTMSVKKKRCDGRLSNVSALLFGKQCLALYGGRLTGLIFIQCDFD